LSNIKRYHLKTILLSIFWISIGVTGIVLLVAAIKKKDAKLCTGVEVNIKSSKNIFYLNEKEIATSINEQLKRDVVGKKISSFNLKSIEQFLQQNIWIQSAQLFFDNNDKLKANVVERTPIARIFTIKGNSFYIDSNLIMLPLSKIFSARLPIFTNFTTDDKVLSNSDSILLKGIKTIAIAVQKDSFRNAMIDAIDITAKKTFVLYPKIGNQIIVLGNANDIEEKFDKLLIFYKQVIAKSNWVDYSEINLQYQNQIVAKKRGKEEKTADSVKTLQMMQMMVLNAQNEMNDTTKIISTDDVLNTSDGSIVQQSVERIDDNKITTVPNRNVLKIDSSKVTQQPKIIVKQQLKKAPLQKAITKPVAKPKIVMKSKN
jgi:cell division protein FtsQ